ncbi:MAG: Lipoprotein-releasing system ATP-binding protein LolD [Firmicutes bacterium ADurb.Bin300]|nr:MAG: Lipoprotein-releasing system ATP-binding protein LolD [Firmicutes bacterium ADurb.Bin300]
MIKIDGLFKTYNKGKANQVNALSDFNISVYEGDFVAIMGPSGAGKSTLLHIIGCVEDFDSGDVVIDGKKIDELNDTELSKFRNKTIGTVFQDFALMNDCTVLDNVELPLLFSGVKRKKRMQLCDKALNMVGMSELKRRNVLELSGGQRQRVAIARAIVNSPKIILADEPTGALDSITSKQIMNMLKKINENAVTVIVVTHEREIAEFCKRTIIISDGKTVSNVRA